MQTADTPEQKPTPTPWSIKGGYNVVAGDRTVATCATLSSNYDFERIDNENRANAAFIVKACNSHEVLVSALERARGCIDRLASRKPERALAETRAEIDAALAKAIGEKQ